MVVPPAVPAGVLAVTGLVWIGPAGEPQCPVHGQMHQDFAKDWWTCAGYDGEGCGYQVTAEEWLAEFTPLGTVSSDGFLPRRV